MKSRSCLAIAAALALIAVAAAAEPAPDLRLKEIERALEKGRVEQERLRQKSLALSQEVAQLRAEMTRAAERAQNQEEALSELEARLADLKGREGERSAALERRSQQMAGVVTAVQRLAWRPSEALLAQPTSPADTVRSAILLRAALPHIERSARDLRNELEALAGLRADIASQREKVVAAAARLEGEHRRLKQMVQRKAQLHLAAAEQGQDAQRRLDRMADEARDLRELMQRLAQERRQRPADEAKAAAAKAPADKAGSKAATPRPFSGALGRMPFPARGQVIGGFGQPGEVGIVRKGISLETRGGAQVIAPYDGQVVFAGPFRGYGQLLIIEHSEGYHTLLAGMSRIDAPVGQQLLAGEPVGMMEDVGGKPTLYIELRHNGQPINPLPWLTARKDKVSG